MIILPEAVTAAATTYLRCGEQPASSPPLAAECSATEPSMEAASTPSSALHVYRMPSVAETSAYITK